LSAMNSALQCPAAAGALCIIKNHHFGPARGVGCNLSSC
jgi:hypothetical protein